MNSDDQNSKNDSYEVGYKKPPKHTQFQPGQSGNRKGRPKGSRNFKTDVLETLKAPVPVTQNGNKRSVSTQKAALMRLQEKALSGDARSLGLLLELARTLNNEEALLVETVRSKDDQAILDDFLARSRTELPATPTTTAPEGGNDNDSQ